MMARPPLAASSSANCSATLDRMKQRQDQHARSQRHAIRNRGEANECLDWREPSGGAIRKMAPDYYAIESKLTRKANLFDMFGETSLH
jgi:hypothetical protein